MVGATEFAIMVESGFVAEETATLLVSWATTADESCASKGSSTENSNKIISEKRNNPFVIGAKIPWTTIPLSNSEWLFRNS
jgi:hypothetical protein